MPGDLLGSDLETIYYIRSESAYNLARRRGFWDIVTRRMVGRDPYLLSFRQSVGDWALHDARYLGMRIIATKDVVGSFACGREFSCSFMPVGSAARQRERWRQSYTRLLTGTVDAPVHVFRAGERCFVVNGHHRMSVARYLNLKTIRAHVFEIEAKGMSDIALDSV